MCVCVFSYVSVYECVTIKAKLIRDCNVSLDLYACSLQRLKCFHRVDFRHTDTLIESICVCVCVRKCITPSFWPLKLQKKNDDKSYMYCILNRVFTGQQTYRWCKSIRD